MEYRVEKKYLITQQQMNALEAKLKSVMKPDANLQGKAYLIRSLYFDDIFDSCMYENESGVDERSKYRLRLYEYTAQNIYLENKEKYRGYTKKMRNIVSREECVQLMDRIPLSFDQRTVVNKLCIAMKIHHMVPKAIIEYDRTAFVYPLGNVRITFDQNISASRHCNDFLMKNVSGKIPILPNGMHILEVKYDELLPDFIAQLIEDGNLTQIAFSKYYLGRLALNGEFVY